MDVEEVEIDEFELDRALWDLDYTDDLDRDAEEAAFFEELDSAEGEAEEPWEGDEDQPKEEEAEDTEDQPKFKTGLDIGDRFLDRMPDASDIDGTTIDGAELLGEVRATIRRFVVLPDEESYDAAALWIAASHAQMSWETAPRLVAISPEKRCGKSRFLDVAEAMCYRPLVTVNISVAAICRLIGDDPPTLMVDEADTIFGSKKSAENNEDVRGILNAGHQRNRPYIRWNMGKNIPEAFETFAFAMLASIGNLPDTIMDRAVVIRMRRRKPDEVVSPFRSRRDRPGLTELYERLKAWGDAHAQELRAAEPEMPVEDRAADTWEPLIAVADAAGSDWPARARKACVALVDKEVTENAEESFGLRLLADIRTAMGPSDYLWTGDLIERLCDMEESPWGEMPRTRERINASRLAYLLKPYNIKSADIKGSSKMKDNNNGKAPVKKGYRKVWFEDVWARYLPDPGDE